jgi:predicted alpha/beta-fold hydrolase
MQKSRPDVWQARSILEFDDHVRCKYYGYKSARQMYKALSCDQFVPHIRTPMLLLYAKDDAITDYKYVPVGDIKRNPALMLATVERGGHCDLQYTGRNWKQKELAPCVIMDYIEKVDSLLSNKT